VIKTKETVRSRKGRNDERMRGRAEGKTDREKKDKGNGKFNVNGFLPQRARRSRRKSKYFVRGTATSNSRAGLTQRARRGNIEEAKMRGGDWVKRGHR